MRSVLEKQKSYNDFLRIVKMFLFSMIFISCIINSEAAQNNENQQQTNPDFGNLMSKKQRWSQAEENFENIPLKLYSAFNSLSNTSEQINSNISSEAVKAELPDLSQFLKTFKGVEQLIPIINTSDYNHETSHSPNDAEQGPAAQSFLSTRVEIRLCSGYIGAQIS